MQQSTNVQQRANQSNLTACRPPTKTTAANASGGRLLRNLQWLRPIVKGRSRSTQPSRGVTSNENRAASLVLPADAHAQWTAGVSKQTPAVARDPLTPLPISTGASLSYQSNDTPAGPQRRGRTDGLVHTPLAHSRTVCTPGVRDAAAVQRTSRAFTKPQTPEPTAHKPTRSLSSPASPLMQRVSCSGGMSPPRRRRETSMPHTPVSSSAPLFACKMDADMAGHRPRHVVSGSLDETVPHSDYLLAAPESYFPDQDVRFNDPHTPLRQSCPAMRTDNAAPASMPPACAEVTAAQPVSRSGRCLGGAQGSTASSADQAQAAPSSAADMHGAGSVFSVAPTEVHTASTQLRCEASDAEYGAGQLGSILSLDDSDASPAHSDRAVQGTPPLPQHERECADSPLHNPEADSGLSARVCESADRCADALEGQECEHALAPPRAADTLSAFARPRPACTPAALTAATPRTGDARTGASLEVHRGRGTLDSAAACTSSNSGDGSSMSLSPATKSLLQMLHNMRAGRADVTTGACLACRPDGSLPCPVMLTPQPTVLILRSTQSHVLHDLMHLTPLRVRRRGRRNAH